MSPRFAGIGPYQSFQTPRNCMPTDPAEIPPKRMCKCGRAYLRPSNPGPCGSCLGVIDPERLAWAEPIVRADDRPSTVQALAAQITGQNRMTQIKQRNEGMRIAFDGGRTRQELADDTGLSWAQVHAILNREQDPDHKRSRRAR